MMTTQQEHAAHATQVALIQAALGHDWRDDSHADHESFRLVHTDGHGIRLSWSRHRVEVSGIWPKSGPHGAEKWPDYGKRPTITVADTKTSATIARDITNRFLPVYLPIWSEQVQRLNAELAYEQQTRETAARIAQATGQKVRTDHNGEPTAAIYLSGYHPYSLTAQGDKVRFEAFSVPADIAEKILPFLKEQAHD